MIYTITEMGIGGEFVVRAELRAKEDFDKLIEKLTAYRNDYYKQKEEPNE